MLHFRRIANEVNEVPQALLRTDQHSFSGWVGPVPKLSQPVKPPKLFELPPPFILCPAPIKISRPQPIQGASKMGTGMIRPKADRFLKVPHRFGNAPEVGQRLAQVVMTIREPGREGDRVLIIGQSLLPAIQRPEGIGPVHQDLSKIRLDRERGIADLDRFLLTVLRGKHAR